MDKTHKMQHQPRLRTPHALPRLEFGLQALTPVIKDKPTPRRLLPISILCSTVFIVGVAFLLRTALLYAYWHYIEDRVIGKTLYGAELGQVAASIAAGHGFSSPLHSIDTGSTAWFTPIYPYLVAGIFKLWGIFSDKSHIIIQILNCAFSAVTIIPIYAIGERIFGRKVAVASSWVWVFLPTSVYFAIAWVWDTSLSALVFALMFWATLAIRSQKRLLPWAGYGALCVLAVLVNPSLFAPLPFLAVWLILEAKRNSLPWKLPIGVAAVIFILGLIPWTVRNYEALGKAIVFRSNFGLELWLGNNPGVPDNWSPWLHPNDDRVEAETYKSMGEISYMAEKQRQAFLFMRTHPVHALNLMYHRFVDTWLTVSEDPADVWLDASMPNKFLLTFEWALSFVGLLGVLFAYRARLPEAAAFGLVLLTYPIVFYVTHTSSRYRFPMDPFVILLSAYGFGQIILLARHRKAQANSSQPVSSASAD